MSFFREIHRNWIIHSLTVCQYAFIPLQRMNNASGVISETQPIDAMGKIKCIVIAEHRCDVYMAATKVNALATGYVEIAGYFIQHQRSMHTACIECMAWFIWTFWKIVSYATISFIQNFFVDQVLEVKLERNSHQISIEQKFWVHMLLLTVSEWNCSRRYWFICCIYSKYVRWTGHKSHQVSCSSKVPNENTFWFVESSISAPISVNFNTR